MDRKVFFDSVRKNLFGGRLTAKQADGLTRILDYREKVWPQMPDNEFAYLLGTAKWETGHSMQPVEEGYPMTGARLRAFQRKLRYFPYYGRGLAQLTHDFNYEHYGIKNDVNKALEWPMALHVLFDGMVRGVFTKKKLSDYFSATRSNWVGARAIVNGTDQAAKIADISKKFYAALQAAGASAPAEKPAPAPLPPEVIPPPVPTPPVAPVAPIKLSPVALLCIGNLLAILLFGWFLLGVRSNTLETRAEAMRTAIACSAPAPQPPPIDIPAPPRRKR